ncbi:MAG: 16S rRNA (uracil(1498)-N(3))-methyltransferase [Chitinophagaceae bacterium]|nr:MAG: 16S rRNA (uracil(1498)-N(3))-methyltransferase [Chitinophagaceae bacterium]
MAYPFFYINHFDEKATVFTLDEVNSKHIVQVLRMQNGEKLHLTDGKGHLIVAEIQENHKKHCVVKWVQSDFIAQKNKVNIAISPIKNNSRFEWFLEKATEIGIHNIFPIITQRTEKANFKWERFQSILVSAMLQSQQRWLPILHQPISYENFIKENTQSDFEKLIAHCVDGDKKTIPLSNAERLILIGPEGDFTVDEIDLALQHHFNPVTLGETRLRTETAAVTATVLLNHLSI